LASIWLQPCSVQLDPKEKSGFKIIVILPCAFYHRRSRLFDVWRVQVQTVKGARKKVFDDSELVLQCESESERDDWMRLLKTFATGP
jgi:hypothetical protein